MVSVIVPVYNIKPYIIACVESVFAQNYHDFELILVDDGSTDGSGVICDHLRERDNRVHVLHKANGGLSSARNAGLDASTGDYIFFLDGDDTIPPNCFSNLVNALEENECDLCIGNYVRFDTSNSDAHTNVNWNGVRILEGREIPNIYLDYGGYFVVAWNKLYRRQVFDHLRYDEGKLHEDEFLAHKIWKKCDKVCCISEIVYHYRYTQNSIMNSTLTVKRLDSIEAYCNRMASFREDAYDMAAQKVEYLLWKEVNTKYFRVNKREDINRMDVLYKMVRRNWRYFIKNPMFTVKEKLAIGVFCVSPACYQRLWGDKYEVVL